jgi:hypothetical protein
MDIDSRAAVVVMYVNLDRGGSAAIACSGNCRIEDRFGT